MFVMRAAGVLLVAALALGAGAAVLASGSRGPALIPASSPGSGSVASRWIAAPRHVGTAEVACDLGRARFSSRGWRTDFGRCSVPLEEFRGGGPGRDGIPPIDRPQFQTVAPADAWLKPREPVVFLEISGDARAYPLQVLIWHEIVNDQVGGQPVAVTFCPLCNTAIAFDRRIEGHTLDFGTTGNLRLSDLVMWDRQTESWWQQATGEAVVGELTGTRLQLLPARIISWAEFREQRPQGRVLSRETGHRRDYGRNPYVGYDDISQSPFLFEGPSDGRLRPMERVVTVSLDGEHVAYPVSALRDHGVVADRVGGRAIVVFFQPGTASALDLSDIASSRDVGSAGVYAAELEGRDLSFTWNGSAFVDRETGSRWTILGQATAGPLADSQLEPMVHVDAFWFATAAFLPQVRVWSP